MWSISAGAVGLLLWQDPESGTGIFERHRPEHTRKITKNIQSREATGKERGYDFGCAKARLLPLLSGGCRPVVPEDQVR